MNFFVQAFNAVLYHPILNALIFIYAILPGHDFGLAIILLTLLLRLLLLPFSRRALINQRKLALIQPKLKEIQQKYGKDRAKAGQEMMLLYQQHKLNPLTAMLPQLLQLPILLALYRAFWRGLNGEQLTALYSFVPRPEILTASFLGLVDLNQPHLGLALLASFLQYYQARLMQAAVPLAKAGGAKNKNQPDFQRMLQKQGLYLLPAFTFMILLQFPSALALYWLTSSFFSIAEQKLLTRQIKLENAPAT